MNMRRLAIPLAATVVVASFSTLVGSLTSASTRELSRVSVASDGSQAIGGGSGLPHISSDGRFVVFSSGANNLVPGDTNFRSDVFIRDRVTRTTERLSVATNGAQGNGSSVRPSVSANGRYVAFMSDSTNFTTTTNHEFEVFVRDRLLGTTERASPSLTGGPPFGGASVPMISSNGRFVTYQSQAGNLVTEPAFWEQIYVFDRLTRVTERVSVSDSGAPASRGAFMPTISGDGRFVAFFSYFSDNLVPGDTNNQPDIFVRDRLTGQTRLVSRAADGSLGDGQSFDPVISEDGRWVAFPSIATNLVPSDTNNNVDAFVTDLQTGAVERVSVSTGGDQAWGFAPKISADGRYVAFESGSDKLVPGPTGFWGHVYLRDRTAGTTVRLSEAPDGAFGNRNSSTAAISGDGRVVAFVSGAFNLVVGDTNGQDDIYVAAPSVDATPPTIAATADRVPDHNDWYTAPVTITFTCADDSGIASCSSPVTLESEGAAVAYLGSATDSAGNSAVTNGTVKIDRTRPSIIGAATPPANASGWNNSAVTVSFTCTDAVSGVASCTAPTTVTSEGVGQSAIGQATDAAGNSASTTVGGINIDLSAPTVRYGGNIGAYTVDQTVTITCEAVDTLSGLSTNSCADVVGPAYALALGLNMYSAVAVDKAGNGATASTTFTVAVTPASLCRLTKQFMQTSAKYAALPTAKRAEIDKLATALCAQLAAMVPDGGPAKRNALITAYNRGVEILVRLEWLTPDQGATLTRLANSL